MNFGSESVVLMFVVPIVLLLLLVILLAQTLFTVDTQQAAIIQRFGKFNAIAQPGLNVKIPFVDKIAKRLSLRVQAINQTVDTKTEDDVTVALAVSVQYKVDPSRVYDAAYSLTNEKAQITAYIFDAVRSVIPTMTLDAAFAAKDQVAAHVGADISKSMEKYGYIIEKTLVTDISPDKAVRAAMNEINAAQRLAEAAKSRAQANRIEIVGAAEGEAEAKKLSGEGIANQRRAIADGLAAQYSTLKEAGIENADEILLMNQYLDTIIQVAREGNANTVFLPGSPGGLNDLTEQIRQSILTSDAATGAL